MKPDAVQTAEDGDQKQPAAASLIYLWSASGVGGFWGRFHTALGFRLSGDRAAHGYPVAHYGTSDVLRLGMLDINELSCEMPHADGLKGSARPQSDRRLGSVANGVAGSVGLA
jgi:hypothetical protein